MAPRTARFEVAAQLNRELAHLGQVLPMLRSTAVAYIAIASLSRPEGIDAWEPGAGGERYLAGIEQSGSLDELSIGVFTDDCGDRYVMLQNPNHEGGSFPNDSTSAITATLELDFSAAPASLDPGALLVFDHRTGAVGELPLIDGEVELTIEAGDIAFFKYKTGRGFATRP